MEKSKELSKHELKELKKQEKEDQNKLEESKKENQKLKKNIIKYSIIGVILVVVIYLFFRISSAPKIEPYTKGPVHWHAELRVFICGEKISVPKELPQGEHHLGLPLLHTHADGLIHIEGQIWKKEDITLGAYMNAINVPFSNDTIMEYKNDGMCNDGKSNKIKMLVNGEENLEYRNYVVKDKDKIEIRYE